jgi:hypothetical protein
VGRGRHGCEVRQGEACDLTTELSVASAGSTLVGWPGPEPMGRGSLENERRGIRGGKCGKLF